VWRPRCSLLVPLFPRPERESFQFSIRTTTCSSPFYFYFIRIIRVLPCQGRSEALDLATQPPPPTMSTTTTCVPIARYYNNRPVRCTIVHPCSWPVVVYDVPTYGFSCANFPRHRIGCLLPHLATAAHGHFAISRLLRK